MALMKNQIDDLTALARKTMEAAHAPYSRYRVGAVVVSDKGGVYTG